MNYDILFIQEYYYYLIVFILLSVFLFFLSYFENQFGKKLIEFVVVLFSLFTSYYIGSREISIGVDTFRYEETYNLYKNSESFFIRKDLFYDYLNFAFSRLFEFQSFLMLIAFIYVFGALYGLKKIFKDNYLLPFLVFLISPYFINNGINVMRSGMASSVFILGIAVFYTNGKKWKWITLLIVSVLLHISFIIPLIFFVITRYIRNVKLVFLIWMSSILMATLKINIIANILNLVDFIADRGGSYTQTSNEESSWGNFFIFGFFPVLFGLYNVLILRYDDKYYKWLINAYMLTHIPYIILINTEYASRLGYMAEFMMPILLMYPLIINPVIKLEYNRLKLTILIFIVFMLKAYKILFI